MPSELAFYMEKTSPFSRYLGTNHAVIGDERMALETFLVQPVTSLRKLKQDLNRAHDYHQALLDQYTKLSQSIEAHRALMAPIRRLPVDVMQEIFIYCLPTKHNSIISRHMCPILLTRICSSWRQVALQTGLLWSSIHVPIPSNLRHSGFGSTPHEHTEPYISAMATVKQRVLAIREWLGRSGTYTLAISLYVKEGISMFTEIYESILDALIPFADRWGSFICDTPPLNLGKISSLPVTAFPRLHTLVIPGKSTSSFEALQTFGTIPWPSSEILLAPNLRNISYNECIMYDFISFPLRWGQLTSITLCGISSLRSDRLNRQKLSTILSRCPLLRYCQILISNYKVRGAEDNFPPMSIPTTITLAHLEELTIDDARDGSLTPVFDALHLPVLEKFKANGSEATASSILALVRRTAHTLRDVTLNPYFYSRDEFFSSISLCQRITSLKFCVNSATPPNYSKLDDPFIMHLLNATPPNPTTSFQPLLPRLSTFICPVTSKISDSCALDVIRARNAAALNSANGTAKLKHVEISFDGIQVRPLLEDIDTLAQEGVDCRFTFKKSVPTPIVHSPTDGVQVLDSPSNYGHASTIYSPTF